MRLLRGDFDAETVYDADPVAVARGFAEQGARWIHVVDLDAARSGAAANLRAIEAIGAAVDCRIQSGGRRAIGGGRRRTCSPRGSHRVVVGTAAVEHPELVDELTTLHPGAVAVGLDARGRDVAVRGWVGGEWSRPRRPSPGGSPTSASRALIVTEIGRDGTLEGPDLDQLGAVLAETDVPVIASGGVGTIEDLRALGGLVRNGRRLDGAIVGRALYERRFTVAEGIAACAASGFRDGRRRLASGHRAAVGTAPTRGLPLNGVVDDGFLRRYRELLDAEDAAFDELEHAVEEGDREHYELDFAAWKETVARRVSFLGRHELLDAAAATA